MKTLDLTVMLFDSIEAKIYLALLKKHGYLPARILLLTVASDTKKYKVVERFFGEKIAMKMLTLYKKFRGSKQKVLSDLDKYLITLNGLYIEDIDNYFKSYPQGGVSQCAVINGLADSKLIQYITDNIQGAVLFTGGGILKEEILAIPRTKFIHIHPGIVPEIRGADCFFWSYLLNERAGYSVFYMNEGIDTGDILHAKEFAINFNNINLDVYSADDIYSSILKVHDPCLRIKTFIELLENNFVECIESAESIDLMDLPYRKQNLDEGRMYFFMHKALRGYVINKIKRTSI
jgi:hypothetical protein